MTPQEYIGTDPYGNSAKMSKIVVSETSYLPLATIKETSKYILYMWMFSNADKTVILYYGNERKTFNLTTSWQQFGFQFESSVNDNITLELPSGIYYIWHPKLEKGNKQTDWTQAPEDVDAKFKEYATLEITNNKITTAVNDAVSTAKSYTDQTADSLKSTVEGVDGRLTTMEQNADGFNWSLESDLNTKIDNIQIGGENLLSDTNVPSYVKKAAPGNRYLSDSSNVSYSTGTFVAVSNLPIPEFTHVYQFDCTTASSTSTDGRSLCFYSGNAIPMIDGQEYTMSMYARKTSGNGKIRFLIGYSSYPNYNNYIDVTSEWERYSYTFTYSDSATGGTGGARCYFGASCAVVGVVQTFGWKLEKGNKATDWNLSAEDIMYASNEAAKTATNYMKFEDDGLTIGNMTEDTLGRNVLIDLDSVDIRNGTEVLATYGEEIILRNNGLDVFTVKKSTFIQQIKSAGRFLEASSESYTGTASNPTNITGKFSSVTTTSGLLYIWHIKTNDRYAIFTSPYTGSLKHLHWSSSSPAYLNEDLTYIPCSYCDSSSVVDLDIKGSVWIDNGSDVNGQVKSLPPLAVGTRGGAHIEIDNNEITAKSNDDTPDILYLNTEGGAVTLLNNTERAMKYQDGKILTRSAEHYDAAEGDVPQYTDWYEVLSMFDDSDFSRIRLGYGTYSKGASTTDIYGYENINLYSSSGNVVSNTSFVVPNSSSYFGTNTSGLLRNNFEPCTIHNECRIGYGSYSAGEGGTGLYGNNVHIGANGSITFYPYGTIKAPSRTLTILWSGGDYMSASQTASLSENVTDQLNGIVLVWSKYSNGAQDYEWNCFFIPKQMVTKHPGAGHAMYCMGAWPSYKYVYINNKSITGASSNDSTSNKINGVSVDSTNHVLRYVIGV